MGYNLLIVDSEIKEYDRYFNDFCNSLETFLGLYKRALDRIMANGIKAGKKHNYLAEFSQYVSETQDLVTAIREEWDGLLEKYISGIEAADRFLYDAEILSVPRDYTDSQYQKLQRILEENRNIIEDVLNGIDKFIYDKINNVLRIVKGGGHTIAERHLQQDFERLLIYYKTTQRDLKTIFDNVHEVDQQYGPKVLEISEMLQSVADLITKMSESISPKNGLGLTKQKISKIRLTFEATKAKVARAFETKSTKEEVDDILDQHTYTNPETQEKSVSYTPGFEEANGLEGPFWEDHNGNTFLESLKLAYGEWQQFYQDELRKFFSNEAFDCNDITYEEYLQMQQMRATLEAMKNESDESETYKQNLRDYKEVVEFYRKYGEKAYEYLNTHRGSDGKLLLDGRTKLAKEYLDKIKKLKYLEKALEIGERAVDYIAILMANHDQELRVIHSLEQSLPDGSSEREQLRRIRVIYDYKVIEIANKFGEDVADWSVETLTDPLKEVLGPLNTIDEITGFSERSKAAYNAMQLISAKATAAKAYNQACLDYVNSDRSEEAAEKVKNTYLYYKQTLVRMYSEMANATTGDKKAYYLYVVSKVEGMSISKEVDIMSYEEFISQDLYENTSIARSKGKHG